MTRWLPAGFFVFAASAFAHQASDSYLGLEVAGAQLRGEWVMALRDLDSAIGLDGNQNGLITSDEFQRAQHEIGNYALSQLV